MEQNSFLRGSVHEKIGIENLSNFNVTYIHKLVFKYLIFADVHINFCDSIFENI